MLVHRKNEAEIQKWISGLYDESSHQRANARRMLLNYGSDSLPALMKTFVDVDHPEARKEALRALKDIDDPLATPFFVKALGDSDRDIRWIAAEALSLYYNKDAFAMALKALLEDTDNYNLRKGVHHVVKLMKEREVFSDPHNILDSLDNGHFVHDRVRVAVENTLLDITRMNWKQYT